MFQNISIEIFQVPNDNLNERKNSSSVNLCLQNSKSGLT